MRISTPTAKPTGASASKCSSFRTAHQSITLVLIEEINILPTLHERVVIPVAVWEELRAPATPGPVRQWIEEQPDWVEIRRPKLKPDERLDHLGRGERDAMLLAQELHAALLIDEARAYREAQRRNIPVLRTLAVLDRASDRGLLDLGKAVARLRQTNFRVRPEILDQLLQRHAARSNPRSEPAEAFPKSERQEPPLDTR